MGEWLQRRGAPREWRCGMKTYVTIWFVIHCIGTLVSLVQLNMDHPRHRSSVNLGGDVSGLLISAGLALWTAWVLWGGAA